MSNLPVEKLKVEGQVYDLLPQIASFSVGDQTAYLIFQTDQTWWSMINKETPLGKIEVTIDDYAVIQYNSQYYLLSQVDEPLQSIHYKGTPTEAIFEW